MELEFKGYWSDRDKQIWQETDWRARDYDELPVEGETFEGFADVYGLPRDEKIRVTFQKHIRANPIYPPYYRPVYDSKLREYMKQHGLVTAMYNGNMEGQYDVHDRFETYELYDMLSR